MSVLFPYHLGFENPEEREQRKRKKEATGMGTASKIHQRAVTGRFRGGYGGGCLEPSEFPNGPANQNGKQGSHPKHKILGTLGWILSLLVFLSWHA